MERITQRQSNDCGVACVGMLIQRYAGCPSSSAYDAAKAAMFGRAIADYTNTKALLKGLSAFNIKSGKKRVPFEKINARDMGLEFDAIIGTKRRKNGNWHWLVWDAEAKTLIDPNPKNNTNGHRSALYYIKISET